MITAAAEQLSWTSPQFIIQALLAVGASTVIATAIRGLFQRKKVSADAASVIAKASTDLLAPLSERVGELGLELAQERRTVLELRSELASLRSELETTRVSLATTRADLRSARDEVELLRAQLH